MLLVCNDKGYTVRVITLEEPERSWQKFYRTKEFCVEQLQAAEMLTSQEAEQTLQTDLDRSEVILQFNAKTNPFLTKRSAFVRRKRPTGTDRKWIFRSVKRQLL
jgi:hypothetical protein